MNACSNCVNLLQASSVPFMYTIAPYYTHTHTRLTALFPGLPGWAGTRKAKPNWILLKQETLSGSGISWAIYKSAPRSRQISTPAPHHSVFTGRMPFLSPKQQRQSTEGSLLLSNKTKKTRSPQTVYFFQTKSHTSVQASIRERSV